MERLPLCGTITAARGGFRITAFVQENVVIACDDDFVSVRLGREPVQLGLEFVMVAGGRQVSCVD